MTRNLSKDLQEVTADSPCVHCGKPDWCYRIGELTVCKRGIGPAPGWEQTSKVDRDGTPYYAFAQPKKPVRPESKKFFFYPDREGNQLIRITRIDDGQGNRKFYQSHWTGRWAKGLPAEVAQQVPVYRYQQIRKAIAAGRLIFMVEGEGCADLLWGLGLAATTTLAGSKKYRSYGDYSQDLAGARLVLCPDRDKPGVAHAEDIATDFPDAQWLYAPPGDFFWEHLPQSQGLDIADWIADGATVEEIHAAIGSKRVVAIESLEQVGNNNSFFHTRTREKSLQILTAPTAEEIFTQKAQEALYGNVRWISLNGSLYKWTGTHYHLSPNPVERGRIAGWCRSTPVEDAQGQWKYAYAKSSFVDAIWNWVVDDFLVDPGAINPPGINCLNGFLEIQWSGPQASWKLLPHDPARLCTYVSEINFDPDIDMKECERLLACLEPAQQKLLIQTLAASLDLATIRRYRGREVRALLLKGHGNNGKDSLREAVRLLYGVGLANATVSDFSAYEQGRKFTLAKLEGARINWSSENSSLSSLDQVQSLKAAITGDPLDMERKGVDEHEMMLSTIFFFNINEAPNLKAGLEAIQSRWAVLSFNKTYKIGADPKKGELEADSRFRYDPNFLKSQVVPGLLNKMLDALTNLASNGIDYGCTQLALQEIQEETNHLWAFAREVGLKYQVGGRVYVKNLWESLQDWYIANATLVITIDEKGKEKREWHDQPRRGDKTIKGSNHIVQRFTELFPKAIKGVESGHHPLHPKGVFLEGIAFGEGSGEGSGEGKNNDISRAGRLGRQFGDPAECLRSMGIKDFLALFDAEQLHQLREELAKLPSQPSHPLPERKIDFPADFPTDLPLPSPGISVENSPGSINASPNNSPRAINGPVTGSDISIGNITKNFGSTSAPVFKEGDKCKAKHPHIWDIPDNKILTIQAINGDIATVTFNGCRSITGSDVLLSELEPLDQQ